MEQNRKLLIDKGVCLLQEKKDVRKDIGYLVKSIATLKQVDKDIPRRLVNVFAREGNGWGSNSVSKDEFYDKKYDVLTILFTKLREVVYDLDSVNRLDVLDPYIKDLKKFGIHLQCDASGETNSDQRLNSLLEELGSLGSQVDDLDEELKQCSIECENIEFAPKSKFSKLNTLAYDASRNKKIEDKIHDEQAATLMYSSALDDISEYE